MIPPEIQGKNLKPTFLSHVPLCYICLNRHTRFSSVKPRFIMHNLLLIFSSCEFTLTSFTLEFQLQAAPTQTKSNGAKVLLAFWLQI